jgi:ribosome-associated protein
MNADDPTGDLIPQLPEAGLELGPGVRCAPGGLRFQFSRGGGPGGQNVNKLNTKAELWLAIEFLTGMDNEAKNRLRALAGKRLTLADELHLTSSAQRTQEANRADALDRLRQLIVAALVRPKRRRKTRPSAASKRRRLESKKHRAEIKANRKPG